MPLRRSAPHRVMKHPTVIALCLVSATIMCRAFVSVPPPTVPTRCLIVRQSPVASHRTPILRSPFLALELASPTKGRSLGWTQRLLSRGQRATATRPLFLSASDLVDQLFAGRGTVPLPLALGINAALFALLQAKLLTMLTPAGFAHSLALGTGLWAALGWRGWSTCVVYLFLGQAVTKVKFADKEARGLAEKRGGRRGPENVWGSAATALLCATAYAQGPLLQLGGQGPAIVAPALLLLGFVASLATKLADTFASEIGKAYGKTCFLITTLERVEPGTEGAVSLEGTLASIVGGLALSLYGYYIGLLPTAGAVVVSTFAAFVATNVESVLGATLQEKKGLEWVSNEVINFFNTFIGAGLAIGLGKFALGLS